MDTHQVTITLRDETYQTLRRAVESGQYASESEAVADFITALDDEESPGDESSIENWLSETVVPIALRMRANPAEGFTGEEVLAHLKEDLGLRRTNAA